MDKQEDGQGDGHTRIATNVQTDGRTDSSNAKCLPHGIDTN